MSVTKLKTTETIDGDWLAKQIELSKHQRFTKGAIQISPTLADAMLERNVGNRKVFAAHVTKLATAMKEGEWMQTHEGLAFDRNGRLLDGQHRLQAVRASGCTIIMDVHFGEAPESFDRIDIGKTRTAGNILDIIGHRNTNNLAAAARVMISINAGATKVRQASNHAIAEYVEKHPDLAEASDFASSVRGKLGPMQSVGGFAAAVYLIHQRMGTAEPSPFFDKLKSGIGIKSEFDPVHRLRERLTKSTRKVQPVEVAALTIKAFNLWHEGATVKTLVWREIDEEFPKVGQ